jgi:ATP-dependent helicase/nuclease subunit B
LVFDAARRFFQLITLQTDTVPGMAAAPRVFTVPPSVPFLPTLIKALVDGRLVPGFPRGGDPLQLASATLYLPTRRACRLAREVFLDAIGKEAAILPRIVALGDIDEDEFAFGEAAGSAMLDVPEPLGGFERRIALTELIFKWAGSARMLGKSGVSLVAQSPAAALRLADDLARLMDDMITRQVSWDRLDGLVPAEVDEFWQDALEFLQIARDAWPKLLAERGKIEPAQRRDRLIEAERMRLQNHADGPVIAAGSTGSMPSTAALLAAIAKLPRGAVVLPGLDTRLDDAAWEMIAADKDDAGAPGHPQFAMQALLRRIGIEREEVAELAPPAPHGREWLLSEVMRPAEATETWPARLNAPEFSAHADAGFADLAVIEAGNAEEEALAIAVALREAVEVPGKKAALVTPDRALARRVLAALGRWQVPVDDSGGDPLADTPAGVFARLAAEVALEGLAPVPLLALLKHPLLRLGSRAGAHASAVAALELAVLRGPRPKPGSDGLVHALASFRAELEKFWRKEPSALHWSDPRVALRRRALDAAAALVVRLKRALAPLEELDAQERPLAEFAVRHRQVVEALGTGRRGGEIFSRDDGGQLASAFDEMAEHGRIRLRPSEYPELFTAAVSGRMVRRPEGKVRVRIFGPLEARLQTVDCMVLGGLVEGVWPPETRSDPWLSRPMRHALGLDLPERRIGLAAHDFAQALGSREVILTRAARQSGAPTVASRFMQRLAAVAGEARWAAACSRGEKYLALARALDAPAEVKPAARPEPRPPVEVRPRQLSVTEIEHWLRDPYTIYAKHILRLMPLDPVDAAPGAADRGMVIHAALAAFTKAHQAQLPDDPLRALLEIGERQFAALADYPEARAFWWPRFVRIAHWFVGFEQERRAGLTRLHAECGGAIEIPLGAQPFRLTARADRIERRADGSYAILDYKTGAVPTERQVRAGFSPQLTLEAAILQRGGFNDIKDISEPVCVSELAYVALRGSVQAGESRTIEFAEGDANTQAQRALQKLTEVAEKFALQETPYRSLVHPMWKTRYGPYDHLARVKEWSLGGEEDE